MMEVYFRCPMRDGRCGSAVQVRRFAFATQGAHLLCSKPTMFIIMVYRLLSVMLLPYNECTASSIEYELCDTTSEHTLSLSASRSYCNGFRKLGVRI